LNIGKRERIPKDTCCSRDIKTNEFLALEVTTDEKVYDGKVMVQLVVEQVLENKNIKIKSQFWLTMEGAYMKVIRISNTFKRKRFCQV
jgi:hypothetical protein